MFPYERRLEQVFREVRESPLLDVVDQHRGPGGPGADTAGLYELLAEDGYPLEPRLLECFFPYRNMALQWRAAASDTPLVGEFDVVSIDVTPDIRLPIDDLTRQDSDRALLSELRILDDISSGGEGRLAAMRFHPGVTNPEIWFLDRYHDYVRLELDYRDYLDNLLITKGATGWQYLFADVPLGEREYGYILENLRTMLRVFPEQFPDYDYAPLATRLEARL
ncbi:hypothetical protein [Streptomyces sp. NPDC088246]|uniref:hypothetical protein n=1 Tax=Streptomyces sp. NPDC088246 TaxID=3365842 RepID=UPI003829CB55